VAKAILFVRRNMRTPFVRWIWRSTVA
jgi:hypothetical protein